LYEQGKHENNYNESPKFSRTHLNMIKNELAYTNHENCMSNLSFVLPKAVHEN
jgi:hypothetical protein